MTTLISPQRRTGGIESDRRAMDLLIDAQGRCRQIWAVDLSNAVWRKGYVHIRQERRAVIVSLSPALVRLPTVDATLTTIANMNPRSTSLIIDESSPAAVTFGANWKAACRRICELSTASQHSHEAPSDKFRHTPKYLGESEKLDDPEYIIFATLKQYARYDPELLTREILDQLWEAGYDVQPNQR
jgi:hypothetical protein